MNSDTILIAGLILVPVLGLVAWAWFTIGRVEAQLRDLGGFEGMHFEIGPQSAKDAEGASAEAGRRR